MQQSCFINVSKLRPEKSTHPLPNKIPLVRFSYFSPRVHRGESIILVSNHSSYYCTYIPPFFASIHYIIINSLSMANSADLNFTSIRKISIYSSATPPPRSCRLLFSNMADTYLRFLVGFFCLRAFSFFDLRVVRLIFWWSYPNALWLFTDLHEYQITLKFLLCSSCQCAVNCMWVSCRHCLPIYGQRFFSVNSYVD